jgi:hypothetical protein
VVDLKAFSNLLFLSIPTKIAHYGTAKQIVKDVEEELEWFIYRNNIKSGSISLSLDGHAALWIAMK